MICQNCREQPLDSTIQHKYCVNDWRLDPKDDAVIVKRDEPIKACACQHKKSWPVKDPNGNCP